LASRAASVFHWVLGATHETADTASESRLSRPGNSDAAEQLPRILRKPFDTEALRDLSQEIMPPRLVKSSGMPLASNTAGTLRKT
jgi:hypothetical protein